MKAYKILIITALYFITGTVSFIFAQEIKKEVEVVKPYEPVVSDANKINILPNINDSVVIKPAFQYSIVPAVIKTDYQVNPINAAKMVSMPLSKLYRSYLKLGIGNAGTPLGELYVNSFRSKKHSAGIYFHHHSSAGKVKLENDERVYAGYSETTGSVFGKRFFKNSYIYGDGSVSGNTNYQYGYNPVIDTVLEKGEIRQTLFLAAINAGIRSSHADSSKLSYHAAFGYKFTQNRFKQNQNGINFNVGGMQRYKMLMLGLNANLNILKPNMALDSFAYTNTVFTLHPFATFGTTEYNVRAGLDINFENQLDKLSFRLYPEAEININIAKNVLIGFVGFRGEVKQHAYSDIYYENPFVNPNLLVKNSYLRSGNYGGIKGSLAAKASYVAKVDFSRIKNQYFYVNDSTSPLLNQFTVLYDDYTKVTINGELNYQITERIGLNTHVNIYQYQLEDEDYAWHMPNFDFLFSVNYNLRNKIIANVDLVGMGKRYAKLPGNTVKELSGVVDFNLGLEYRYTKILSAWLKLNNITASKYNIWNFYPSQRFNFMIGITYSL
jgi:hypothetical protein